MKKIICLAVMTLGMSCAAFEPAAFQPLPIGAVKPQRWLKTQLELQKDGLTGHAEELYADIGQSDWLTHAEKGHEFAWERGPYYARGLLALAYVLDDPKLKARAACWAEAFFAGMKPSGDFGPKEENWWANALVLYFMRDWYSATRDRRALDFLDAYFTFLEKRLPEHPLKGDAAGWMPWACARGGDILSVLIWHAEETKSEKFLPLMRLVAAQTAPWTSYYKKGYPNTAYQNHIVNFNQGMKNPALMWRLTGDSFHADGYLAATQPDGWAMRKCGRPDAMFNGMEQLATRSPSDATELCAQVERMISCAEEIAARGTVRAADDMERIAYNTLPSTLSPDGKGMRYYHLMNQPKCANEELGYHDNGKGVNGNVISPESGFGCCRSNFHIGWPKFVQSMWMSAPGGGLAAVTYGPCAVTAKTAAGEVTLSVETDYPFTGKVTIRVEKGGGRFPVFTRIPTWCARPDAGTFIRHEREWKTGDVIELDLSARPEAVAACAGGVTLVRGALLFAFAPKAEEKRTKDYGTGFVTCELRASQAWNWALDVRPGKAPAVAVEEAEVVSGNPFAPGNAPVKMRVPAAKSDFGMWGSFIVGGCSGLACDPPPLPVPRENPLEEITLAPMGSTQLRIAVFPSLSQPCNNIVTLRPAPGDATLRIQKAIDDCFRAGGGTVTLENGEYPVKGLRLRSNVTLYLKSGVLVKASRNCDDFVILSKDALEPPYPGDISTDPRWEDAGTYAERVFKCTNVYGSRWNNAIIRIYRAHDAAIIGEKGSVIDGMNSYDPTNEEAYRGVHGVSAHMSRNLTFRGYTILNTGNWAHQLRDCQDLLFEDVEILAGHDGVHMSSCDRARIVSCVMQTGDDCIGGFDNSDVEVVGCDLNTACSAFRFGGRRVRVENTFCHGPGRYLFRGSLSKEEKISGAMSGKNMRRNMLSLFTYYCDATLKVREAPGDIIFKNCRCENVDRFLHYNFSGNELWQKFTPLADIRFENMKAEGIKLPLCAYGAESCPISLSFENCSIAFGEPQKEFIRGAFPGRFVLRNVDVKGVHGPLLRSWGGEAKLETENVTGIEIKTERATDPFHVKAI
jgi:hypothetical protein